MHFEYLVDMPVIIKNDFIKMFCGKLIGSGIHRQVYEHKYDDTLVIKIEYADTKVFANIREWTTWCEVQYDTNIGKYFAPCFDISENGLVLLQKKTTPMKKYPKEIPVFFTDTKVQNYGMYNGQFVCHDYAGNLSLQKGSTKRMTKAEWWGF